MGLQAKIIGADGEVVAVNRSKLLEQSDRVPTTERTGQVYGDTREEATKALVARLQKSASMLGSNSSVVRLSVSQNVDALQQAVEALENTDEYTAKWANDQNDLVTETADSTTVVDVVVGSAYLATEAATQAAAGTSGAGADDVTSSDDTGHM